MRREVSISVFAVFIVAAAILSVYYLNVGPTGFAIFQQNTQSAFDEGTYSNVVYDSNASAVALDTNQTSGTYTSKILDAGNSSTWNNLTWQGNGITFEVRNCAAADCSDANFTTVSDLNNLNLSGQYFQYKASFDSENDSLSDVTVDYTVTVQQQQQAVPITVSISQPTGEKTSLSDVPLEFTIADGTGTNLTCLYSVTYGSPIKELVANTSISCTTGTNTQTFDLTDEGGDNTLTLYVNDTSGSASDSTAFSLNVPETKNTTTTTTEEEETQIPVQQQTPSITQISLGTVSSQDIIQGNSKTLSLSVQNTGTEPVSSCALSGTGDNSEMISISDAAKDIAAGESSSYSFSVNVPESKSIGAYTLSLSLTCSETSGSTTFSVNVLQKKLDFNITEVQRTRQNRVSVDYIITELAGEDQDLQIYFSIKDSSGTEVANATQNRSIDANKTDDFRTNIPINESLNGTMTLSTTFNSQIYSSSVLEPIDLSTVTGSAILGGVGGAGGAIILIIVVLVLVTVFFISRRLRQSGKTLGDLFGNSK